MSLDAAAAIRWRTKNWITTCSGISATYGTKDGQKWKSDVKRSIAIYESYFDLLSQWEQIPMAWILSVWIHCISWNICPDCFVQMSSTLENLKYHTLYDQHHLVAAEINTFTHKKLNCGFRSFHRNLLHFFELVRSTGDNRVMWKNVWYICSTNLGLCTCSDCVHRCQC